MMFTVLGSSGSIGSALHAHLEEAGAPVFAPARGDEAIFERPLGHVVYCIGVTADFRTRLSETVEAHVELLRRLVTEARYDSLLYLSSTRVYRGLHVGKESAELHVRPAEVDDLYNLSKLLGEALCLSAAGGNARVVRLSNVVGPGARSPSFVRSLLESVLDGETIQLDTRPSSVKDYVDIRDVVELLPRLVEGRSRLYNVASGRQTTHEELAATIASLTGAKVVADPAAPETSFPPTSIRRVVDEFGFSPRPLSESLEDMVAADPHAHN